MVDPEPLLGRARAVEEGDERGRLVLARMEGEMVPERDGPVPLDHHVGGPAHRAQPVPELGGVVDRRRQAHKGELGWREHEYLLPHASPVGVLEVVHLVQDDRGEAAQEVRAGEQHVAQHFGGHDHHWGVGRLAVSR